MERYSAKQLWQNMISDTGHKSYAVMMLSCHFWSLTGPGYHLFLIIGLGKRSAWTSCLIFYRRKKSYRFWSMSNWWQIFHFWLNCWWQIWNSIWSNYDSGAFPSPNIRISSLRGHGSFSCSSSDTGSWVQLIALWLFNITSCYIHVMQKDSSNNTQSTVSLL